MDGEHVPHWIITQSNPTYAQVLVNMLASPEPALFPPEIIDEIIDLLDETSTLLSFGPVSK